MARRPFDSQYEDPYDSWPTSRQSWFVWLVFFAPGALITWTEYMFPKRGEVWASRRRAHNKIIQVIYSLSFWATIIVLSFVLYRAYNAKHQRETAWAQESQRNIEQHQIYQEAPQAQQPYRPPQPAPAPQGDITALENEIIGDIRDCWGQAGYHFPAGYVPVVRIFFDDDGNIANHPLLANRPQTPQFRAAGSMAVQLVRQCQIEIPDNLKYISKIWRFRNVRIDPTMLGSP